MASISRFILSMWLISKMLLRREKSRHSTLSSQNARGLTISRALGAVVNHYMENQAFLANVNLHWQVFIWFPQSDTGWEIQGVIVSRDEVMSVALHVIISTLSQRFIQFVLVFLLLFILFNKFILCHLFIYKSAFPHLVSISVWL